MEKTISRLLTAYEAGALTRRQVVTGLAGLVATATEASSATLSGDALDHVSLLVGNLDRSTAFYRDVLGLVEARGARPDGSVRLNLPGSGYLTLRRATPSPSGIVDHFCIRLSGFDKEAVTRQLKARGIVPIDEPNFTGTGAGFHITDPDGISVQLV